MRILIATATAGAGHLAAAAALDETWRALQRGTRDRPRRGAVISGAADGDPSGPLVVSIVTDFEAHALWMEECVDLYCVAAEETKARLVARGAKAANIVATGIPISAKFSQKIDGRAVRKKLGLRDDLDVLLVLSGGFGMGPVAEIVTELDKVEADFQMLVVSGRNE